MSSLSFNNNHCAYKSFCTGLFGVTIRQALFIAPCSHAFHYKCIRPLLETHHSAFSCPLCRTFADLEEDVEVEPEVEPEGEGEADIEADQDPAGEAEGSGSGECDSGPAEVNLLPSISARTWDRSREREAGAETEVEVDGNGVRARLGVQRSRTHPQQQMHAVIDLTEPDQEEDDLHDTEMMDTADSTDLSHRRRVSFEGGDLDTADAARSTSLSPDFVGHGHEHMNDQGGGAGQAYNMPRAGTSGAAVGDTSEGEGSGGSAEGIAMDEIIGSASGGEGGDLTVGGKRKR